MQPSKDCQADVYSHIVRGALLHSKRYPFTMWKRLFCRVKDALLRGIGYVIVAHSCGIYMQAVAGQTVMSAHPVCR